MHEGKGRRVCVRGKGEECVCEGEGRGMFVSGRHIRNMTIKGIS